MRAFLRNEDGVSAIEYGILFGGVAFLIIIGGMSAVGPAISERLGNAFEPTAGVMPSAAAKSSGGGCQANGGFGNCGIGLGNNGGNGTSNEGNGKGPGKEKEFNPGKGHK